MLHKNTLLCAGLGAVFLFAQVPLASAAVVTSMKPLGFIAAAIADGVTETQVLLPDGASEHDYSLRPSDVKRLQNADLVVWIGPEMEAFMDKSTQSIAANKKVTIAELDGVKPLLITGADDDDDHHGHDHGAAEKGDGDHHHGIYNMHLWLSPEIARLSAVAIHDKLLELMPQSRAKPRVDNGFKMSSELQKGDWVNSVLKGTVGASFVSSARDAGLTSTEISAVIKAMQWQMDFRKLKKGDEFSVLMSREMLDGKREQSQLLGVRLRSDGKDYYAIRAEDGKFYDRNGTGLAKGFMRFPTARQFRVSSNFNPRRLNPVTGRVAPHRGVDFAMPQGTPVLAVGDGEVVVAKRSGAAGYYVAIRHGRTYTTRYMHLRKLLVKPGQKVKRGDRIALSGNTGRSTGPHLHYEVWINQQAVNPLTAKLPRTEGLSGSDRTDYLAQVKEVVPQLRFD